MSNRWISQSGAGTLAGTSFANRAPESDKVAQEAAVGLGEFLYISAETITLTSALTITGDGKSIVGVNATTGAVDGSLATIDAGNTYANCVTATGRSFIQFANLEVIRATGAGIVTGAGFSVYNVYARNNGTVGINGNTYGSIKNSKANNNTTIGMTCNYGLMSYCQSIGNGAQGFYGEFSGVSNSLSHANVTGVQYCSATNCIIDGNTTGVNNVGGSPYSPLVNNCSITYNTTGISSVSSGAVYDINNYFYSNTTKFGGTTANIRSLDSTDGAVDPYTNRGSDNFTPTSTAPKLNTQVKIGNLAESTNFTYENMGFNPLSVSPITVTDINPATGASGASIVITGTNFTGSGNIVKLGGSGGTSCTITAQSTTSITFTVPAIATGTYDVYIENSSGLNIVVPNGFILTSATVPVFAGITHFEILSNNKFYIKTGTATNSPIYLVYYIRTATNPFGVAYSFKVAYSANKELVIGEESGHFAPLVAGTTYYCGVRAENANGEDTNVVELSNICSGTAMIQRQTITVLSAK